MAYRSPSRNSIAFFPWTKPKTSSQEYSNGPILLVGTLSPAPCHPKHPPECTRDPAHTANESEGQPAGGPQPEPVWPSQPGMGPRTEATRLLVRSEALPSQEVSSQRHFFGKTLEKMFWRKNTRILKFIFNLIHIKTLKMYVFMEYSMMFWSMYTLWNV
jgi:hypothetical protein